MKMASERRIAATPDAVWRALNDPEILRQSILGCEKLERLSDTELVGEVTAKVGPVKAKFAGKLRLSDVEPPHGYKIIGEGHAAAAGFAKGGAVVRLRPDGEETILAYDVEANVGGKLAQLGSRLIDTTARKFADDFFERFRRQVEANAPATGEEETNATTQPSRALQPLIWVPGLILIVLLILFVFSQSHG